MKKLKHFGDIEDERKLLSIAKRAKQNMDLPWYATEQEKLIHASRF